MRTDALLTIIVCGIALGGCRSDKGQIELKAAAVREAASAVRSDASLIRDNAQDLAGVVQPDYAGKVEAIVDAATRIDHQAERVGQAAAIISESAQGVTDIVPWWQRLLGYSLWTLLGGLIVLALAWYGLLPFVVRAIAGLASKIPALASALIPPSIRSAAKLDYEAMDAANPNQAAAVAVKRTSPLYDAAYRLAKAGKGKP
jgi:hypothetical protein